MALTQEQKQKAYRIRQKAKKDRAKVKSIAKKSRKSTDPRMKEIESDSHMQACLDGKADDVQGHFKRIGGGFTTYVGPTYGPVTIGKETKAD
ncbi:unnamed protein product, partial [marine sediment metagenome]